jgi:hypothetical protein
LLRSLNANALKGNLIVHVIIYCTARWFNMERCMCNTCRLWVQKTHMRRHLR